MKLLIVALDAAPRDVGPLAELDVVLFVASASTTTIKYNHAGGDVSVDSAPGSGSAFTVELAAAESPGHAARLRANGARAYLTKPLDVTEMLSLLDDILNEGPR